MFTAAFLKASAERAVRAGAAALLALLGAGATNVIAGLDWVAALQVTASGAAVSFLLSIAGSQLGPGPGPSFTGSEVTSPPAPPAETLPDH